MRLPRPQPWGLGLFLVLLPGALSAGEGLPGTREVPASGKWAKSEIPRSSRGTSFSAAFRLDSHDLFSLWRSVWKTPVPFFLGPAPTTLPPTPPGSGPSVWGGVFSLPGCLSHLGPPPHLLSSPAENHRSLQYHFTAVSAPAAGTPAFWVSGWLGPQQYLSYNNLRAQAEPYGAWVWESQVSWYWEKETTDLRNQEKLFLQALQVLGEGEMGTSWAGSLDPGSEGGGDGGPPAPRLLIRVWAPQAPSPCRACWAASWALIMSRCRWPSLP